MAVYLDYNASAPIDSRVLDYMFEVYKSYVGNPDSRTHDFGNNARGIVENARANVAELIGVKKDEVFFTSGSTESNNIAVLGLAEYGLTCGKKHIVTTAIEHKSVLESVKHLTTLGFQADFVEPGKDGSIRSNDVLDRVREDTLLVSAMHVNNETGAIQPVDKIGSALANSDVLFHTDITQSCGKLVDEIRNLKCNMMSFSAHKLAGPQGVGCLVLKKKQYKLPPVKNIIYGGAQEHGLRPGTVPVALIAGLGKACEVALAEHITNHQRASSIKTTLLTLLNNSSVSYKINGGLDNTVNTTLNISFPGVSSEALMIATKQYCGISNGSACTSRSYTPSYVLKSMKLSTDEIESSVRISWGGSSDISLIKNEFIKLIEVVLQLQK